MVTYCGSQCFGSGPWSRIFEPAGLSQSQSQFGALKAQPRSGLSAKAFRGCPGLAAPSDSESQPTAQYSQISENLDSFCSLRLKPLFGDQSA